MCRRHWLPKGCCCPAGGCCCFRVTFHSCSLLPSLAAYSQVSSTWYRFFLGCPVNTFRPRIGPSLLLGSFFNVLLVCVSWWLQFESCVVECLSGETVVSCCWFVMCPRCRWLGGLSVLGPMVSCGGGRFSADSQSIDSLLALAHRRASPCFHGTVSSVCCVLVPAKSMTSSSSGLVLSDELREGSRDFFAALVWVFDLHFRGSL